MPTKQTPPRSDRQLVRRFSDATSYGVEISIASGQIRIGVFNASKLRWSFWLSSKSNSYVRNGSWQLRLWRVAVAYRPNAELKDGKE